MLEETKNKITDERVVAALDEATHRGLSVAPVNRPATTWAEHKGQAALEKHTRNDRVHPEFAMHSSGAIYSLNPPMHQLSSSSQRVVADEGYEFLSCSLVTGNLVALAKLSKDPQLTAIFAQSGDFWEAVIAAMGGAVERSTAKDVLLGWLYAGPERIPLKRLLSQQGVEPVPWKLRKGTGPYAKFFSVRFTDEETAEVEQKIANALSTAAQLVGAIEKAFPQANEWLNCRSNLKRQQARAFRLVGKATLDALAEMLEVNGGAKLAYIEHGEICFQVPSGTADVAQALSDAFVNVMTKRFSGVKVRIDTELSEHL